VSLEHEKRVRRDGGLLDEEKRSPDMMLEVDDVAVDELKEFSG